ncbi:MAG TPA: carbohydrate kinase family protein [Candidatus Limnocylindria bacterium]
MAESPLIVVVGDATLDIHVHPTMRVRPRGDVPADIRLGPGGQGANVAVRLARRGHRVRLVCGIADDAAGRIIRAALETDGVTLHDLGAGASGAVIVLLDADGDRTMLSHRAPLGGRLDTAAVADAEWLIVSGYVLAEREQKGLEAAAPHIGRRIVLGCSLEPSQAPAWADAVASLRPHLTILNDAEAATLAGVDERPVALSRRIGDRLGGLAIVSHRAGATVAVGNDDVEVELPAAGRAVDTTGAGDALAAGVVSSLIGADWPPDAGQMRLTLAAAIETAADVASLAGAQARTRLEPGGTVPS